MTVFFPAEAEAADNPSETILKLHVPHFASDMDAFQGFLDHSGGEQGLLLSFNGADRRRPFTRWHPVDERFKDLVSRMICIGLNRRITAREALKHPFFSEIVCDRGKEEEMRAYLQIRSTSLR